MSAALLLAACNKAEKKQMSDNISYVYTILTIGLHYLQKSTSDVIANLVDGLLENDNAGTCRCRRLVSLTRRLDLYLQGYVKVSNGILEGEEYAEVKAQDWLAWSMLQMGDQMDTYPRLYQRFGRVC